MTESTDGAIPNEKLAGLSPETQANVLIAQQQALEAQQRAQTQQKFNEAADATSLVGDVAIELGGSSVVEVGVQGVSAAVGAVKDHVSQVGGTADESVGTGLFETGGADGAGSGFSTGGEIAADGFDLGEMASDLLENGMEMVSSAAGSVAEVVPSLLEGAGEVAGSIAEGAADVLGEVIGGIASGL